MNGMMTEREWRRQYPKRKSAPDWYGAQYVLPAAKRSGLRQDRSFRLFLLLLSVTAAVLIPIVYPVQTQEDFAQIIEVDDVPFTEPRYVSTISYSADPSLEWHSRTYSRAQLSHGKMLLLDDRHLLPDDIPPPNTFSIAAYGKGMIPIVDLGIQSGRETIDALQQWFSALRREGVTSLMVCGGTVSAAQQRAHQLQFFRSMMKEQSIEQAFTKTRLETERPNTGEMLQEYTVELQLNDPQNAEQWQMVLRTAWRYGFIRTKPDGLGRLPYRFRYVGKAHATAMTFLDLAFEEYLEWMHRKGMLTIYEKNLPKYVILCQPAKSSHVQFMLPYGAEYEVSLDNTGYAFAACTL